MDKRIIFPNDNGSIAIIIPAKSVQLALKDVPQGKPYAIVDVSDLPQDRLFRNAWEYTGEWDYDPNAPVEVIEPEVPVEDPLVEESSTEEPVVEEPPAEEPPAEEPVVEDPTIEPAPEEQP